MWWLLGLAWALPSVDQAVPGEVPRPGDAAVVIGIEDYFLLPDVPHAARDAAAMEQFLRVTRGIPGDRIRTLGVGANREQIVDAVDRMAALVGPGDTLWLTYAGHGAADPATGEQVLLGADAQADALSFQARSVPVAELESRAVAGGGQAIFILDTCYSGRARGGADLIEGKRFAVPTYAQRGERVTRWTAAGPSEWSSPLEAARHGAFTYTVLGALRGWADGASGSPADGQVTIAEAHAYVLRSLGELDITGQRPVLDTPADLVLSTAREPAPDLSGDTAVLGRLLGPVPASPIPTVAQLRPGPGVDPSARGPYTQKWAPHRATLRTGINTAAFGGLVAALSYAWFRSTTPTEGTFTAQQVVNITGGSIFFTGVGVMGLSLLPTRQGPIVPQEASP